MGKPCSAVCSCTNLVVVCNKCTSKSCLYRNDSKSANIGYCTNCSMHSFENCVQQLSVNLLPNGPITKDVAGLDRTLPKSLANHKKKSPLRQC